MGIKTQASPIPSQQAWVGCMIPMTKNRHKKNKELDDQALESVSGGNNPGMTFNAPVIFGSSEPSKTKRSKSSPGMFGDGSAFSDMG